MATATLSYDALSQMKFNDFRKAVKEKSQWRKARALVLLFDYKMGSKKTPIVLPLRRPNQLKPLLKQIKADKHPNQKLAAGTLSIGKGVNGPEVVFTMTHGGYKLSGVTAKIAPLFKSLLKMNFRAEQGSASDVEAAPASVPLDEVTPEKDTTIPIETASTVNNKKAEKEEAQAVKKAQLQADAKKVKPLLQKITQQTKLLRSQVVSNIKTKTITPDDQKQTKYLATLVDQFMVLYQQFSPKAQQKIQPYHHKITAQVQPFLNKIEKALQQITHNTQDPPEQPLEKETAPIETTNVPNPNKELKQQEERVKEPEQGFQSQEEVEQFLTEAMAGIQHLLQEMGSTN